MASAHSKSRQLRVRITASEHNLLEKLRAERNQGETVSELVREAIALLIKQTSDDTSSGLSPKVQTELKRLAGLLNREPRQVEEACIEGIIDLIDAKCAVPLIVMETHLHLKYRAKGGKEKLPWPPPEPAQGQTSLPEKPAKS
ncbi:MAG TPA: hypothetical protein VL981_05100 [Candidatus Methylacidiphilales bacterium]|nr:hypothetical protein [Candidatus Methylacidiphilales bacterium]